MYLHQKCANCKEYKDKKCKGYKFIDTLKNVEIFCKRYKENN